MKTFAGMALIAFFTVQSHAASMTQEEQNKIVAKDQARWASIKTGNYAFVAPPANWKRVQDPDLHFSVYFPCEPKRTVDTEIQYACVYNKTSYGVIAGKSDFRNPMVIQYHEVGQSYQIQKRFLDAYGAPVIATPIIRTNYDGATGRQETIVSAKLTIGTRVLYKPDFFVSMVVGAATGKLPNDHAAFFDTLQFGK